MNSGDISGVLIAGFSVVVLVLFLVQAIREAFPALGSQFLPLVSLFVAVGLVALANYAPADITQTVATGIAVGAAASLSVRYVKNGDSGKPETDSVSDSVPPPRPAFPVNVPTPEAEAKAERPLTYPPIVSDGVLREANPRITVAMPLTK